MIFAEIAAFFIAVCTTDAGNVDQKCLRQMHECWIYEMSQGKNPDPWFWGEVCSEQWWP
jgi:hypothetical protein